MKKLIAAALLGLIVAGPVSAACTVTYSFSNGTTADASQVNANFSDVVNCANAPVVTSLTNSGNVTFTAASAKIIPGATSLLFRNNADNATNFSILNNGNATFNSASGVSVNTTTGNTLTVNRTSGPGNVQFMYNGTESGQVQAANGDGLVIYTGSTPVEKARINASGYFKATNNGTYNNSAAAWHELNSDHNSASFPVVSIKHSAATATNQNGIWVQLTGDPNDATRYRSGRGNLNNTIGGNSGYKVGPKAV